jgi:serine/threonine protein phosphatase PrpC
MEAAHERVDVPVVRLGRRSQLLAPLSVVQQGARAVSGETRNAHLYFGDEVRGDLELPQGLVCVRSRRSPEKDTPNEDSAAVIPIGASALVAAVADGVGGAPHGREASQTAIRALRAALWDGAVEPERVRHAILDALETANKEILEMGRGAATTIVVAEISGNRLRAYHVGDSEIMSVGQRGRVKQRVTPHSPTGFAVEAGLLDENEAVQHDQRHVLFNVIGAPDMRVEMGTAVSIAVHDTVLLASDGLFDNVFPDEIIKIIRTGPLDVVADRLMEVAGKRMAGPDGTKPSKPDDLTVVLYRRG